MKTISTAILLLTIIGHTHGQGSEIYGGGLNQLYKFVAENIQLSSEDKKAKTDGVVVVKFKIVKSTIDSVTVINRVTDKIDNEVVRVMKNTNGRWTSSNAGFFLMEIKCTIDYDGKLDTETVKNKLTKAIKKNDLKGIEIYRNEIRRRTPFDTDNLKQLVIFYKGQNRIEDADQIESLINDLNSFSQKGLILGR